MKPVTQHFKLFSADRVAGIRLRRELGLQESRDALLKKKTKKKSGTSKSKKSKKKFVMTPKTQAAYDAATPEVKAMFKDFL